jgi:Flp pilus assembly protein TadG
MSKRTRRRGQALVESSIVIVTLLVMIVGIMDFGQFLFLHQALTDRARAGARYAIANTYDVTAIKNVVLYDTPVAPSGQTTGLFGLEASHVNVIASPNALAPTRIEVNISGFPMSFLSPYISRSYTHRTIRAIRQVEGLGATN